MIKYDLTIMREAKKLFPDAGELHSMIERGDPKAVDYVHMRVGFNIDEDDILRAFRNKKESKLLEAAKRSKMVREFYQKMYMHTYKQHNAVAEKLEYGDCL